MLREAKMYIPLNITHSSELRGEEEAACTQRMNELFTGT